MRYFPLFLDLAGKPVLLVGGGDVAARKFALLAEAGAVVTVVAPLLKGELAAVFERGGISWRQREFRADDIDGHWLVIAATNDRGVNAAAADAAQAARIPCNVVDDRELSSFIMPAIIDRSPVQIAVSTGGSSPVLARLIRERLETLLDESLGTLATFAERWRDRVRARFGDIGARRRFLSWMLTGPVAAKGEAGWLTLDNRRAVQIPVGDGGEFDGSYPADDAAAIATISGLRDEGVAYIAFPSTSRWWLDHYGKLREYIASNYEVVVDDDDLVVFHVRETVAA